jgi:hypothetical protein
VLVEECEEFSLEAALLMMFLLTRDAGHGWRYLRLSNRERAVPFVPFKIRHRAVGGMQCDEALLISRMALAIRKADGRESKRWM